MNPNYLFSSLGITVLLGVASAILFVALARRLGHKGEMNVYGIGLSVAAAVYLFFALAYGAPADRIAIEGAGILVFSLAAALGARRWPLMLAAGWTAHVAWDMFLHNRQSGSFAPAWYPITCVGFDLFLGGYIAGAIIGRAGVRGAVRE